MEIDAKVSAGVVTPRSAKILAIELFGRIAKVLDAVISSIGIQMVNVVQRPLAMHVEPSQPVSQVSSRIDRYSVVSLDATAFHNEVGAVPHLMALRCPHLSGEYPGFRVVVKKLTQTRGCKIGLSHDALQMLIGQRPGSVSALNGPRYFLTLSLAPHREVLPRAAQLGVFVIGGGPPADGFGLEHGGSDHGLTSLEDQRR